LKIFEILWVLLNAKMGKKGTRAKPKQTNPPEGDKCSFPKNSAKDAVVAAKAQPAQLMTDLRKELNVGDEQYSPMSMIASVLGSPQQAEEPFLSGWLKAEKMLRKYPKPAIGEDPSDWISKIMLCALIHDPGTYQTLSTTENLTLAEAEQICLAEEQAKSTQKQMEAVHQGHPTSMNNMESHTDVVSVQQVERSSNQLTQKLAEEINVRNDRVSNVVPSPCTQIRVNQEEMQRQARIDREREERKEMERERRHREYMEELFKPFTCTKLAQNINCGTMADVAVTPAEILKVTDTAKAPAEKAKAPKTVEVPNTSKLNVPAAHPNFSVMIHAAIAALKEHNGSSRQAIVKYIMSNYKVGTDQKAIDSSVKEALKSSIQKGLLKAIRNVDDKRATEAPQAAEAQKATNSPKRAEASEAKAPEATEAQKIIGAIADNAVAPTATAKAIEAKVPEAIEAQEMIDSRVKATLESVIQEDPLEHSEGKDTSGFPKVVPKVNAMKATKAKKHDAIKMAKTTKKATGVTKRSTKAKKPTGANKSKREKTTNPLKRAQAAEKFKAPKAEAAKKPKAAKPKMTPAKKVRKNFDAAQRIWTKKKRKERWKHPWKEKRKERWKHPWKEKEEREMEASMERKRGKRDGSIYNILI
jgi:histone H1/5